MRKGKKQIIIYLDEKDDADLIAMCKDRGYTRTIRQALMMMEMGMRLYPDLDREEASIGGMADGAE